MKKKGQSSFGIIGFLLIGLVLIFITYLVAVPMLKVWNDISGELKSPEVFGSDNKSLEKINQVDSFIPSAFDQIVVIGFLGLILVLLVMSIFFTDHPIFIIFLVIGFILVIIIGSQFVNVADSVANNEILQNSSDSFTLSSLIFGKALPIILLIAGITSVIIIMSRRTIA